MIRVTLTFTAKELELLRSLASDQLFRREFIDPRLPGYKREVSELVLGKRLLERLRLAMERPQKRRRQAEAELPFKDSATTGRKVQRCPLTS